MRRRRSLVTIARRAARPLRHIRQSEVARFASWQRQHGHDLAPLVRLVRLLVR